MKIIKTLDKYLLLNFLKSLSAMLVICIFIFLMQFIWTHIADLVGKGVGLSVLLEFFMYAMATIFPLALPLAILLTSLMTFGNISETFELTAMKAAGISLFKIMQPLIFTIALLSYGAFLFSNHVLPYTQVKLWCLIFSLRQKSPELDIPVGEFYSQLQGYNLYVRHKNIRTGMLYDLMIYDYSNGFKDAKVMVADSGKILFTNDKKYLLFCLYNGESFENLNEQQQRATKTIKSVPYRREIFSCKNILIDFNTDLNRIDDYGLKSQHIAKNIGELLHSADSVKNIMTKKEQDMGHDLVSKHYLGREIVPNNRIDTFVSISTTDNLNADSLYASFENNKKKQAIQIAIEKANTKKNLIQYNAIVLQDNKIYIRKHFMEFYRKFTLSFACLIFFFIGAPLGAIIKKGGFGFAFVVSFLFFIFYYIIDNVGYKMAKEFVVPIWEGMWLSSFVILPIGLWLTYKASTDSTLINEERWRKLFDMSIMAIRRLISLVHKRKPVIHP